MPAAQHVTRTGQFQARVDELSEVSPRMRRIVLAAPAIADVRWPLGCDIAIVLSAPDGREVRRRYTVRSADGPRLTLDAVLHGHGPGSTWAAQLQVGDTVHFFGPRGEIGTPAADWYLALTDESGLPAVAAVVETIPDRPVTVLAEIADDAEQYPMPAGVDAHWLVRGDREAGYPDLQHAALAALDVPAGNGYAYVLGESRAVVQLRDALGRLGLTRERVYAKGYWNLNARSSR